MTRRRNRERGQTMVEFGMVVVVFMVIVLGIVEAGRAVWNYNTLSNAVREGTRYAMVHGANSGQPSGPAADDTKVRQAVEKFSSGLDRSDLTVSSRWPDGANERGDKVRVRATYRFDSMFSGLLGIPSITMSSASTMTITN